MDRLDLKPLALSQGDPAGIGPDIALLAWSRRHETGLPAFIYIGDPQVLRVRAQQLSLPVNIEEAQPEEACALFKDALPVFPISTGTEVVAGHPHVDTAHSTIKAIEAAVSLTMKGQASAVVTNPIAKSVLYEAGFTFPGHTEFLADLATRAVGHEVKPVMMLAGPKLRAVPVTIHIPLKDVPLRLTRDLILETCRITNHDLKQRFGLAWPRLALSGLNPHAGEDGKMGREEMEIIQPAVELLREEGMDILGPLPADTMFHDAARSRYDVAICMYHDQALIPAKALGFDDSVNVTLGLPFVRTSPDHGTAFAIAGKGIASESSLVAAIKLAAELARHNGARS